MDAKKRDFPKWEMGERVGLYNPLEGSFRLFPGDKDI